MSALSSWVTIDEMLDTPLHPRTNNWPFNLDKHKGTIPFDRLSPLLQAIKQRCKELENMPWKKIVSYFIIYLAQITIIKDVRDNKPKVINLKWEGGVFTFERHPIDVPPNTSEWEAVRTPLRSTYHLAM